MTTKTFKRRQKRKRLKWRSKTRRTVAPGNEFPTSVDHSSVESIRTMARAWYITRPDVTDTGLPYADLLQLFHDHEAEFVPHSIQLTKGEFQAFSTSCTYPTYGECWVHDIYALVRKYTSTLRKLVVDFGSGRGLTASAFFLASSCIDVYGCELSDQRFESCCAWLTILAKRLNYYTSMNDERTIVTVVGPAPLNRCLVIHRRDLFTAPSHDWMKAADLVFFNVHLAVERLTEPITRLFSPLRPNVPILAYLETKQTFPSSLLKEKRSECIRTDWRPVNGYAFRVFCRRVTGGVAGCPTDHERVVPDP